MKSISNTENVIFPFTVRRGLGYYLVWSSDCSQIQPLLSFDTPSPNILGRKKTSTELPRQQRAGPPWSLGTIPAGLLSALTVPATSIPCLRTLSLFLKFFHEVLPVSPFPLMVYFCSCCCCCCYFSFGNLP